MSFEKTRFYRIHYRIQVCAMLYYKYTYIMYKQYANKYNKSTINIMEVGDGGR